MPKNKTISANPCRVAAGKLNREKRGALTLEGHLRLREAALSRQPWNYSSGPKTPTGKAQAALNGKKRQLGPRSIREIRAELANVVAVIEASREGRKQVNRLLGLEREGVD
jgi:hypothetical protein